MTSTTDTAGHPDVTEISDFTEGLLPPSRTADVRQHLDECELCADVHASLEEIRGLLGTLPGPPRMPGDVAGRIDAALAAEALLNASAPEPTTEDGDATGEPVATPHLGSDTRSGTSGAPVSRETSTAPDRPAGRARVSSTGPGRKNRTDRTDHRDGKDRRRAGRRRAAVLGAVLSVAVLGLGSVLWTSLTGSEPGTTAQERQTTAADTFSEGRLKTQVADLLAERQGSRKDSRSPDRHIETTPGSGQPRVFQQPTVEVPPCVQQGIGHEGEALATEEGIYKGTDALLVVLADASDPARVTVFIVESTCVKEPAAGTAKVLLKQSYPR
ncbi:anti-sigma factor [Streptomyces sp. NPDC052676]|uniref:anti-sigma factor family protein n=1 Tax=Streptomyces sp. NPDC052676 TaxID=3154953 RepID=UPI003439EFDE